MSIVKNNWLPCDELTITADNATEATATRVTAGLGNITRGELVGFHAHQDDGTVGVTTLRFYANSTRTQLLAEFTLTTTGAGTAYTAGSDATDALSIPKPFKSGIWIAMTHASAADADWRITAEIREIAGRQ